MARKRYSDEDVLKLPREIELKLADGSDVRTACRAVGVSDATNYNEPSSRHWSERQWRMLRKIVAELELDKLILKESLNNLKPRA